MCNNRDEFEMNYVNEKKLDLNSYILLYDILEKGK